MNKLAAIFIFIFTSVSINAQLVTSFSTDKEKFLKELEQFMTASKIPQNQQVMGEFQKLTKDKKISDAWLTEIITTSNFMAERLMTPATHFYNYLSAVVNAAKTSKTDEQFTQWSKVMNDVIKNQKKGDNNDFLKMADFSNSFFEKGALMSSNTKTWFVESNIYKIVYEVNKPRVIFAVTELKGFSRGDTVAIRQTQGSYLPLEQKWEGKSGRVDWGRAGLDPAKVYCTFNEYSISLNNFSYSIEPVNFYYTDYFKQPIVGRLTDKMVSGGDSTGLRYPRFESKDSAMEIKDIAPNVSYVGGFGLFGNKVIGSGTADSKPKLVFYKRDGKTKVLAATSPTIYIRKGEELGAEKAEVSIYFGNDSIYHPQLNVVYKVDKREMRLLRGETGIGKAKFYDSYHNHEFQTDAIFWNLDSSILNLKILSGVGVKPGIFESVNYFNKDIIRKIQGVASYEPLSVLKKLSEKTGSRELNATEAARALDPKLTEVQARSLFYELVENGFIIYNEELGIVTLKEKAINYVLANAKKIDYDIIRIKSAPQRGNDFIDLNNNNLDLKGVFEVPISDTSYVYFRPKDNAISLQKDRNMEFDGLIFAGRMDLHGQQFKFNYTPFTVDLTHVDTMIINVQDSGKTDIYGNAQLKPLKSRVENFKGLLEIDAPINKSGRTRLPQFPRLYSLEKSYVYYDDPTVAKGAYNRKDFFFEMEPWRLDSLNNFSGDIINWKGKLVSGGIFPDIKDSVHIQADGSLGFKSETPKGGYPLYGGKGQYFGKFELNYEGLKGEGDARITHSTADFMAHDIRLYPDSMLGTTDSFSIAKTFDGVKTPAVKGFDDEIFWKPNSDSMFITQRSAEHPFAMYDDGFTTFKGGLLLTNKGLRGNGTLDWNEATLSSKDFAFRTMDLSADTASLNIKTTGDKVTFKTPNVNAKVDFKTRIGDFVSNQKNIPTEFSYNQYSTNINEFKWFMDEKILDFKAPPQGPGEYFTSLNPQQKGLNFLGKRAIYYLTSSILRIEQVPEIKIADASVVPDSGLVIIEEGAKMNQLRNATIYADTITKKHKIEEATVDIFSKAELKAVGKYTYVTKGIKEIVEMNDVGCKKVLVGPRKNKQQENWQLHATADIKETDNFVLYPDVKFNGQIKLTSVNPLLRFKGYSTINLKHAGATSTDFFVDQDVSPDTLGLRFDTAKNSAGLRISAGIHLSRQEVEEGVWSTNMYSTMLAPKRDVKDVTLFKTLGILAQNNKGEYLFGNEKKIRQGALVGNLLTYDDKKGVLKAEGKFSLGTYFGLIKNVTAGSAESNFDSATLKFNLSFGLDMKMGDKLPERFEFYMAGDNADMPDIDYSSDRQRKVIHELADEKADKKILEEFDQTALFNKRFKDLNHYIVFNDVNFVFDTIDGTLRSTGKIGVAMIGKKVINKKLDGFIEFQYKGGADLFTIYLVTGTKDWFYFEYRPGTLSILSSYDDINNMIAALPADKRKIKGEKDRFYLYTLGSSINKTDFVAYMTDRANGVFRPRPEPVFNLAIPEDKSQLPVGDDSIPDNSDYVVPGSEPELTPEQLEIIEQEKERQQLEMMKMGNQNILSGPPPDRVKPKEEPKKEQAPVKEQQQQPEPVQEQQPPVEQPMPQQPAPEEQKPDKKDAKKKKATTTKQEEPAPEQQAPTPNEGSTTGEPVQNEAAPSGNNNSVIIQDAPVEEPKKGKQKKGKKQEEVPSDQPE
ncbi:MAG: hypothetical protein KIS94_03325 [Chitinophagales bacterium]|nr:hypothetical protein [Chitinophagales bacterium]